MSGYHSHFILDHDMRTHFSCMQGKKGPTKFLLCYIKINELKGFNVF